MDVISNWIKKFLLLTADSVHGQLHGLQKRLKTTSYLGWKVLTLAAMKEAAKVTNFKQNVIHTD